MDSSHSNEATRLWRVFRTAHQMVHDRVNKAELSWYQIDVYFLFRDI